MKKLLFIILTLLFTNELFAIGGMCHVAYAQTGMSSSYSTQTCYSKLWQTSLNPNTVGCIKLRQCEPGEKDNSGEIFEYDKGLFLFDNEAGLSEIPNPQPNSNSPRCEDTFIKDGKFYNCNPSTNEATFVENSDGYEEKEDGIYPKCKGGFSVHNIGRLTASGTQNQFYCLKSSNDSPSSWVGQTPVDTSSASGTYNTNSNGNISWAGTNGNDYSYSPSTGVLLETNFKTGSGSAHAVGSSFTPGSSYTPNGLGYAPNPDGTYGNTGTGGGDTGTGGGDTGTGGGSTGGGDTGTGGGSTGNGDTPIDKTPSANACSDSALTLQERMLCEMNQGIKKLNSESAPSNSLNQLMKDLNYKTTETLDSLDILKNNTNVINDNIQDTNTKLAITNSKLSSLNDNTSTTNTKLDSLNTTLGTLNDTLKNIETNTKDNDSTIIGGGSTGGSTEGESKDISLDSINSKADSISSGIDSLFDIYSTFSSNIQNQFSNIKTQIEDTQSLIVEPSNIFNKTEVSSCPTSYIIDFSSFGIPNKTIIIDFCQYTSTLKPLVYFFVYITLMFGLVSFCFRFIGVII